MCVCQGLRVVDYCLVENEKFSMIESFKVTTMSESVEELGCKGMVTRIPDHSLLSWEIGVDCVEEREEEVVENGVEKRYRVPEGYLESEAEGVRRLRERVMAAGEDQVVIDEVYEELVKMMRGYWCRLRWGGARVGNSDSPSWKSLSG